PNEERLSNGPANASTFSCYRHRALFTAAQSKRVFELGLTGGPLKPSFGLSGEFAGRKLARCLGDRSDFSNPARLCTPGFARGFGRGRRRPLAPQPWAATRHVRRSRRR